MGFGANVSVQRVSYDSTGPVFFNQAKGFLAYVFPNSQLVPGSVSLLYSHAYDFPQLKPAMIG